MDWSNERYVRLYVRDTKTWIKLGWEGQAVLSLALRKMDRAGILDDIHDGEDLAVIFSNGMPTELVQVGLDRLIKLEVVEQTQSGIIMPNFIEAQEAAQSDKQRARACRENRRARAQLLALRKDSSLGQSGPSEETGSSQNVTDESQNVSLASRPVTGCHSASQRVTPSCTVPSRTVPTKSNINCTTTKSRGASALDPQGRVSSSSEDSSPSQPSFLTPETKQTSKTSGSKKTKKAKEAKSYATWTAYAEAYTKRYGVEPAESVQTRSMCCTLVNRLGASQAPEVAAYYLTTENRLYGGSGHDLGLLVRDWQKIRTMMLSGKQISFRNAGQRSRLKDQYNVWDNVIKNHTDGGGGES